ncbi:MAG: DUF1501 domain-containing protein [Cyclobacteriaceae bacterium]
MKRRTFLRHASHAVAVPGLLGSLGFTMSGKNALASLLQHASDNDHVLVIIYLEGGNDGLNTVVPLDQLSQLNRVRSHVVLPENQLLPLRKSEVALHPSLTRFQTLHNEGRLGIVQSVGYPEQNCSHFRSTDIWMSGSDSNQLVNSGWTGRYLDNRFPGFPENYPNETVGDPLAVEIGYGASLVFQGPQAAMSMVISNPESFYDLVENVEKPAPNTLAGDKLKYIRLIARQSELYGEVVKQAAAKVTQQRNYPENNQLAQQLKIVSRLIAGGLQTPLYLVRLGGFDTHDSQVMESDHTQGEHAQLLTTLNDAVGVFMDDLELNGVDDRVVGMTFSEFGRRIVSNASLGTDHGSAAPMFVFGNKVVGDVIGSNPTIPLNATYEDNLPMQYDFRQIYASLLEQWLEASPGDSAQALLNSFETVPIIGDGILTSLEGEELLKVYPNPVVGRTQVEFISAGGLTEVDLIDLQGRRVQQIFSGHVSAGPQFVSWNPGQVNAGQYIVVVKGSERQASQKVIVAR